MALINKEINELNNKMENGKMHGGNAAQFFIR